MYNQNCLWATFEAWFQFVYCKKKVIDNGETKSEMSVGRRTKILWSDESSFQQYPTRANVRVQGRRGEEYIPAWTVATVKHGGGSIMVWGQQPNIDL